jgi:hypothetical protein
MKKSLVGIALGVAASLSVVSSYGQGSVSFSNYSPANGVDAAVTFGQDGFAGPSGTTAVTAGMAVGSEFSASFRYSIDGGNTWLTDATGVSGAYPAAFYATDGDTANGAGYFGIGNTISMPSWSSGAVMGIVDVTSADGLWTGASAPFSIPSGSIGTGTTPPGFLSGLSAFSVTTAPIPEPATFALFGLGSVALLLFRRRK